MNEQEVSEEIQKGKIKIFLKQWIWQSPKIIKHSKSSGKREVNSNRLHSEFEKASNKLSSNTAQGKQNKTNKQKKLQNPKLVGGKDG